MEKNQSKPSVRYAEDKPKDCRYCYWWGSQSGGCELGEKNCYYILPSEKHKKKSRCDGCSYGRVNPCIGYCMKEIMHGNKEAGK